MASTHPDHPKNIKSLEGQEAIKKLAINDALANFSNLFREKYMYFMNFLTGGIFIGQDINRNAQPQEVVYSTARLIARVYHKYESELVKYVDETKLKDIATKLKNLYKEEHEITTQLNDLYECLSILRNPEIADSEFKKVTGDIETIVKELKDLQEKAEKKRKYILMLPTGSPIGLGIDITKQIKK
jgi:hypothetical protein